MREGKMGIGGANSSTAKEAGKLDASQDDLIALGRQLYDLALVRSSDETITDPRGNKIGWLLDTRIPMLDSACFQRVGRALSERLAEKQVYQVLGFGFGSYAIVSSILSGCEPGIVKGGFIREHRKSHGRRRIVEGPVDRSKPVVLIDDILNSGRSALKAVDLAESDGYSVVGIMTLFNFTWSGGKEKIEQRNIWVDSLLDLNLRSTESADGSDRLTDSHSDGHATSQ